MSPLFAIIDEFLSTERPETEKLVPGPHAAIRIGPPITRNVALVSGISIAAASNLLPTRVLQTANALLSIAPAVDTPNRRYPKRPPSCIEAALPHSRTSSIVKFLKPLRPYSHEMLDHQVQTTHLV